MSEDKKIREISLDELEGYRKNGFLTVKRLKGMLEKLPDDGLVLVQRVEDMYYEENGWGVLKKPGEFYYQYKMMNEEIRAGKFDNKEEYPEINPENLKEIPEEELELYKEQYHPAWCCLKYNDDKHLYIDLHY